ncbi:GNAT family N-acetyltransferase [Nonomuraea sp. NPDC005730]|uniref:GNAT family N-acetyltransferase n=1 Tax=Nonomuraea sp. NPDC005730 TaxID=3157055 RepID=UPI0033CB3B1F
MDSPSPPPLTSRICSTRPPPSSHLARPASSSPSSTAHHLHLAIRLDGTAIGLQSMWATDFAISRTVETGSWIGLAHQGRGYGTEARMAVLEPAFTRAPLRLAGSSWSRPGGLRRR